MVNPWWKEQFLYNVCKFPPKPGRPDRCWGWTGALTLIPDLYGFTPGPDGLLMLAHRASWLVHVQPVPLRASVVQTCGNSLCVNPTHLRLVPEHGCV